MNHLRMLDILVGFTIFLVLGTHLLTVAAINATSVSTGADYETIVKVVEANPLAKYAFLNKQTGIVFKVVLSPALVFALYFYMRKKVTIDVLTYYVYTLFFISLINFNNDLGSLIGVLIRLGG